MRGFIKLLIVGLVIAGCPRLVQARSGAGWKSQHGDPGKGGLIGAGGGAASEFSLPPASWAFESPHTIRISETPPESASADTPSGAQADPGSRELVEEKEAEASFLAAHEVAPIRLDTELPYDFYQDPLKSLQYSLTLPLEEIDLAAFDIPITVNEEVANWIEFFLTRGRRFYSGWLARSNRYVPMIEEMLEEEGVPRDLVYVAMIESGFSPQATSPMRAAGMWQLMPSTGKAYGVHVDRWLDERRDPEKATRAAVRHLRDLYERFGDWYLAVAAYNAGPARIARALERTGARDFWTLARGTSLRPETRNYVPKMLAAAIIAKNPDRFGFQDITYDDVLLYDSVQVAGPTDLEVIAERTGIDYDEIVGLNPELRQRRTPPGSYDIKLPAGTAALYEVNFKDLAEDVRLVYRHHRVQRGQTLTSIARYYGVLPDELMRMNNLSSARMKVGTMLLVPQQDAPLAPNEEELDDQASTALALAEVAEVPGVPSGIEATAAAEHGRVFHHRVRAGETLGHIAGRYGVKVSSLERWNRLSGRRLLQVGQELIIYPRSAVPGDERRERTPDAVVYQVKAGDSMWSIARRYTVSVDDLKRWNHLSDGAVLQVGQRLDIHTMR